MTEPTHSDIQQYWDKQAKEHGKEPTATAPDRHYRALEISRILPHIPVTSRVLDIGCGNGYSTAEFARTIRSSHFLGVDFANDMIKEARQTILTNLEFQVGDILNLKALDKRFDAIICTRCLINLHNWEEQKEAILQMKSVLPSGGRLILVENTQEGLNNLNKLRTSMGLHSIKVRWHNAYLPQNELIGFLRSAKFDIQHTDNIGNLYYIISRVVYAKIAQMEGKEPQYEHPLNEIASKLPSLSGYHYSPNFMFVLRSA